MISRRGFFAAGAVTAGAAVTSGVISADLAAANERKVSETAVLKKREKFFGKHQNGIELALQTFTAFIAFDLKPQTDRAAMLRWMNLLTDDIARLSDGLAPIADPHEELSPGPARFTATVGFGPSIFKKLGLEAQMPKSFDDLPAFKIDNLQAEFSNGDVLLHVSADDPIVLSHGIRALVRDSMSFADVRYMQQGFSNAQGVVPHGVTQRNLMGQVDGTDNPQLDTNDFENLVWINDGPDWIQGGTILVFRRIAMKLNTWDLLGRDEKEKVIGRNLENGAALGQSKESDIPDFELKNELGGTVIPLFAHIRRAHATAPNERFFRRPFNFEESMSPDGTPDVGMLWTAYMQNLDTQFIPVQRRLEQFDLLNKWTTPIGSAVWAIARGVEPGEILAQDLFG